MGTSFDAAIVGAGVAGLSAAGALLKSGFRVCLVVEAQAKLGGRGRTLRDGSVPVEMGAEFIDGSGVSTWNVLHNAGITACDVTEETWLWRRGKLCRAPTISDEINHFLGRLSKPRNDVSFAQFLDRYCARKS